MRKWELFFDLELGRYGGEAVFLGNLENRYQNPLPNF